MRQPLSGIGVGIVGLGAYFPEKVRTNDDWPESIRTAAEERSRARTDVTLSVDRAAHDADATVDPEVVRHAGPYFADPFRGTKERRVMGDGERPSDMEAAACRAALADAGVSADEVDLLLGFSQVRDYVATGNECRVAHLVGLPRHATALEAGSGCSSFVGQLRLAARLIESGEHRTALLYCSSAVSRLTSYDAPSSVVSGDGAVAAVVRRVDDGFGYIAEATAVYGEWFGGIQAAPADRPDLPWYEPGYRGPFRVTRVDPDAAHHVGTRAATVMREVTSRLFEKSGYTPADVDFMALSQAGAWFGAAMREALGLDDSKVLAPADHFARYAHMMAASAPANLYLAHRLGRLRRGALVLLYAPGAGFNVSAALVRWNLEAR